MEALRQKGDDFTADAVEHSGVELSGPEAIFHAPPDLQVTLELAARTLTELAETVLGRRIKIRVTPGDPTKRAQNVSAGPAAPPAGEAAARAMAHPQVQRFLATFGGQVREVRDLKEI